MMGSAFPADGLGSSETVVVSTFDSDDDPLVVHLPHKECPENPPHRMSECGRFADEQERT